MANASPITQQIRSPTPQARVPQTDFTVSDVEDCLIYNRHGSSVTFKSLFQNHKAVIIFVRNFLCYTCKEYVEDLSKIPQETLQAAEIRLVVIGQSCYSHIEAFCSLTGYQHEIYVDPERQIYKKLGLRRGETYIETGPVVDFVHFDMNRFNHAPINQLLRLARIEEVNFNRHAKIIHI